MLMFNSVFFVFMAVFIICIHAIEISLLFWLVSVKSINKCFKFSYVASASCRLLMLWLIWRKNTP